LKDNVTEAPNKNKPYQQPVFFIQVKNSVILRNEKIPIGSTLNNWNSMMSSAIGDLPASIIVQ